MTFPPSSTARTVLELVDGGQTPDRRPAVAPMGDARPTIIHAVGSRAGFVRIAPVIRALERQGTFRQLVVDAGHPDPPDDQDWADCPFGIPEPVAALGAGGRAATHAARTAHALAAFERVLLHERPALVVIAGHVDATLACALAAVKLEMPVAHLEAGLRSCDWTSPEEINRVLIDRLADSLLATSPEAEENLLGEGVVDGRIHHVGNPIVDWLRECEPRARRRRAWRAFDMDEQEYVLVALADAVAGDEGRLAALVAAVGQAASRAPVVMPLHPYARAHLAGAGLAGTLSRAGVRCPRWPGWLDLLSLECGAGAIVTDAGGLQDEASALGIPCFTLGRVTERRATLTQGTNVLLGGDPGAVAVVEPCRRPPTPAAIPLWDGHAAERIAEVLAANYAVRSPIAT